ncbi:MAG: GNAT family N-acetyltransferase [Acidobacteriia bacterium]|nr:GNAT family N-acetyltransferase [Terriglobia bacterium]
MAEIEGTQAAALGGFPLDASRWSRVSAALSQVQQGLGWTEADLAASQQRTAPVWSCFLADAGADWGIENVAVLPEFRGQGAVDALLRETVQEARAKGFKLAQVSTYIGNEAMAVYERAGFHFSDERRCETLEAALGTPGFVRFLLPISL